MSVANQVKQTAIDTTIHFFDPNGLFDTVKSKIIEIYTAYPSHTRAEKLAKIKAMIIAAEPLAEKIFEDELSLLIRVGVIYANIQYPALVPLTSAVGAAAETELNK